MRKKGKEVSVSYKRVEKEKLENKQLLTMKFLERKMLRM